MQACPSREILARIGDKWSLMLIVALIDAPMRFGALQRRLEGISQKMLTQSLRHLERDGLISRKVYAQVPLRVEYALTASGQSLAPLVLALKHWAQDHMKRVAASQARYARRSGASKFS